MDSIPIFLDILSSVYIVLWALYFGSLIWAFGQLSPYQQRFAKVNVHGGAGLLISICWLLSRLFV